MTETYRFKLGEFDCIVIPDNNRPSTISQEIADVPPAELSAAMRDLGYPSDEVQLGYDCLMVNTGAQRVLIDTGTGQGDLIKQLQSEGIGPEMVDIIIITHGDGDHIGGIVNDQGQLAFPGARYIMWREAWDMWSQAEKRAHMLEQFLALMRRRGVSQADLARMAEGRAAYGTRTLPLIQDKTELVELETEFLPGFKAIAAPGHRTDHIALIITSGEERLLHVADALRHPVQVAHPDWNGFIDSFPQQAAQTRRRLLQRAAEEGALVFTTHVTFPGLGHIQQEADGWVWQPVG